MISGLYFWDQRMPTLLKFVTLVDAVSDRLGKLAAWTVLISAMICALNAVVRYGIASLSSNAALEIQWYMFAWMVMIGAPLVLKLNEHVRVDLIYGKLSGNKPVWIDIFGLLAFLLPTMGFMFYTTWPYFMNILTSSEMSENAGGLIRWPAVLAMPIGFAMVFIQGLAEIMKRLAYMKGLYQMDTHYEKPLQ